MKKLILIFLLFSYGICFAQINKYEDISIGGGITNVGTMYGMADFGKVGFYVNTNVTHLAGGFTVNYLPKLHFGMGLMWMTDIEKHGYDGWIGYDIAPKNWDFGVITMAHANSYQAGVGVIITYRIFTNVFKNTSIVSKKHKRKYPCRNKNSVYALNPIQYWKNK